jgi:hypothetical protein
MDLAFRLHGSRIAVLAVSRLNKTDPGRPLTVNDIPGRAEVVYRASSVLLLEPSVPPKASTAVTPTVLRVAKVPDGGSRGDIQLDHHYPVSRFTERATESRRGPVASPGPTAAQAKHRRRFAGN